MSKHTTDS